MTNTLSANKKNDEMFFEVQNMTLNKNSTYQLLQDVRDNLENTNGYFSKIFP